MRPNSIGVLVDVQNLYFGGLNHDPPGKIDFAELQLFIERELTKWFHSQPDPAYAGNYFMPSFMHAAYVVKTPRYNGLKFFALLHKLGYRLRYRQYPEGLDPLADWKGSVGAMMQMDYLEWCSSHAAMVVMSGNGVFAPVFEASKYNWPSVRRILCTWKHTMHAAYENRQDIVDDIIYLDDSVFR